MIDICLLLNLCSLIPNRSDIFGLLIKTVLVIQEYLWRLMRLIVHWKYERGCVLSEAWLSGGTARVKEKIHRAAHWAAGVGVARGQKHAAPTQF